MRRQCWGGLAVWVLLGVGLPSANGQSQDAPNISVDKSRAAPPTGTLPTARWLKYSTKPLQPGEIDRLIDAELAKVGIKAAAMVNDEQFVRRVFLDVTGKPPSPADISQYLADKSDDKRAKLIDRLLDSGDHAKHWSRYWRNVIISRQTDFRAQIFALNFENWLTKQLQKNRSWALIVDDILTASETIRLDDRETNGQAFFIATRFGADAKTELAAETSRIFLGIQIQCAQCHHHPSDIWKRQDFHEFTAYFARVRSQQVLEEKRLAGLKIVSTPFGEHQLDNTNPKKKMGNPIHPRFLQGNSPGNFLTDQARRRALASSIVSQENPWFAGAYVNRIWGELMGQAFVMPIDDMGPEKEVLMPEVLARISGSFRGSAYDVKKLMREILLSDVYRRQLRAGVMEQFAAAAQPTRLQADTLWNSLVAALGPFNAGPAPKGKAKPQGGPGFGLENAFKREFSYDPSTKPADVENSISQALMMMNNPQINQKIQAKGDNLLAKILAAHQDNEEAVKALYLHTLARQPTDRELARCKSFIATVGNRAEAFEDILWTLINSTEFQTRK